MVFLAAGGTGFAWGPHPRITEAGHRYRLAVRWVESLADVMVRWRTEDNAPAVELAPLVKGETERIFTAPEKVRYAQLFLRTGASPRSVWRNVSFVPEP